MTTMLLLALAVALPVGAAARRSVHRLSGGMDALAWAWAILPPGLGMLLGLMVSPDPLLSPATLWLGLTGAIMLALAATDRQTAWAPDVLTVPMVALASLGLVGPAAMLSLAGFAAVAAGLVCMLLLRVLHARLADRLPACPPPPDIMAFAVGPMILGIDMAYAAAMVATSVILATIRLAPWTACLFQRREAVDKAALDLGYEARMGPAVPLLAIVMPVCFLALLLQRGSGL